MKFSILDRLSGSGVWWVSRGHSPAPTSGGVLADFKGRINEIFVGHENAQFDNCSFIRRAIFAKLAFLGDSFVRPLTDAAG